MAMMLNRKKNLDAEGGDNNEEATNLLDRPRQPASSSKSKCSMCTCQSCALYTFLALVVLLYATVSLIRDIFPETELVLNSKCSAPMTNWDGKLFKIPIWSSSYVGRPSYFNLHHENQYHGNDTNYHIELLNDAGKKRPVVIFGTHHKTGTFLAKKLFSRVCSKMNWCCLFHVTRDSIHAVSNSLQTEPVNALGHNQWIWNPNALDLADYRFIHFYRHPFKKIISGYRYHADGTEEWTQKPLTYDHTCSSKLLTNSHSTDRATSTSPVAAATTKSTDRRLASNGTYPVTAADSISSHSAASPSVNSKVVWDYCAGIHLCETCCRMEHEREITNSRTGTSTSKSSKRVESFQRSVEEYQFICDHLGSGKKMMEQALPSNLHHPETLQHFTRTEHPSIQDMLQFLPAREGILTEAALDYYENLRMARIINETRNDPNTLNIDIDDLNDNFSDVTLRLLKFLEGIIPSSRIKELHRDLAFYDLQTSTFYRWSMSNPIVNHITGTSAPPSKSRPPAPLPSNPGTSGAGSAHLKGSSGTIGTSTLPSAQHEELPTVQTATSTYLMSVLNTDKQVTKLYAPILEMMESVIKK